MQYPDGAIESVPYQPGPGLLRGAYRYYPDYPGPVRLAADAEGAPTEIWPDLSVSYVIGDDAIYTFPSPSGGSYQLCTTPIVNGDVWPDPFADCVELEANVSAIFEEGGSITYGRGAVGTGSQFGGLVHIGGLSATEGLQVNVVWQAGAGSELDHFQVEGDVLVRSYEGSFRAHVEGSSLLIGGPGTGRWILYDGWVHQLATADSSSSSKQFVRFPAHYGQLPESLLPEALANAMSNFVVGSPGFFWVHRTKDAAGSLIVHMPWTPPECDAEAACLPSKSCVDGFCVED